jgi:hypothetical protein
MLLSAVDRAPTAMQADRLACGMRSTILNAQLRLNRFFRILEMRSLKDSLTGGGFVAGLCLVAAGVLANCGRSGANLGILRLFGFCFLCSTSDIAVGGGTEANDCRGADLLAIVSSTIGGGVIVGWLVSMMTRSGGC